MSLSIMNKLRCFVLISLLELSISGLYFLIAVDVGTTAIGDDGERERELDEYFTQHYGKEQDSDRSPVYSLLYVQVSLIRGKAKDSIIQSGPQRWRPYTWISIARRASQPRKMIFFTLFDICTIELIRFLQK